MDPLRTNATVLMNLTTAIKSIAARQAAKRERQGLGVPLVSDALEILKEECPEFFISSVIEPVTNQPCKTNPIRAHRGRLKATQLNS